MDHNMNTVMALTCDSKHVGTVDVSQAENALRKLLAASINSPDLVALGNSRCYITAKDGLVLTVMFYDCFWLDPEDREEQTLRDALNVLCEIASETALLTCRDHNEYVAAVNSNAIRNANAGVRDARGFI